MCHSKCFLVLVYNSTVYIFQLVSYNLIISCVYDLSTHIYLAVSHHSHNKMLWTSHHGHLRTWTRTAMIPSTTCRTLIFPGKSHLPWCCATEEFALVTTNWEMKLITPEIFGPVRETCLSGLVVPQSAPSTPTNNILIWSQVFLHLCWVQLE